ncbi:MAG: MmgE/PrpD family protein [Rhodospirillales bacterium]|nr:MmgE/PrpD family protein [Rhodospirillales bacterium]
MTQLGREIAAFAAGLNAATLPRNVVEGLRVAATDGLAAMLSGVPETVTQRMVAYAASDGQRGEAAIVGFPVRASLAGAALADGTMGHACDFDDSSWSMWGHATAPVLGAILPIAEHRDVSGRDLLAALAVGLEVEKILGLCVNPKHYSTGWHPTGTLGVFGAAAAAARCLGLDRNGVQMAVGIAASMSSAVRVNSGTMTKALHVGFASRNGVEAALFAGAGVTANPQALEGPRGFLATYGLGAQIDDGLTKRLGNPFEVVDPGLSPKLYPCCSDLHAAVDAVLDFRAEHRLRPEDVKLIRCGTTPLGRLNARYRNPETPLQAKFSMEYCLASALARGRLGLPEFDPPAIAEAPVRKLMERIRVEVHPDLSGEDGVTFSAPAIVEIDLADGRTLKKTVWEMRGHPKNPVPASAIEEKFIACAERVLEPDAVRNAATILRDLHRADSVRPLIRELTRPKAARQN